ncbi:MAG: pgk, phosphoglycerate kinase [Candidatus Saccharibacteria bacterium]|nr:pgk, phosphoglycerate kinase [Candidatus Saccharibacteria bacterium]
MSFYKQTIRDVPLDGKTVLVRADYNVPLDEDNHISDDLRIRASLPTLEYLIKRGCKIVIISHLGRPEGRDAALSLQQVSERLAVLLGRNVDFIDQTIGDKVRQLVKRAPSSSIILLENLRYYAEEEANNTDFAKQIAEDSGARYFIQDGFGVVHRAHASTDAITAYLPSVAGLLLETEYTRITEAMERPKRPLIAVMGGAKVSDKIGIIERFVEVADTIIIGGAMANTFLAYKGFSLGASKLETDQNDTIKAIYAAAEKKVGHKVDEFIVLPTDVAVSTSISHLSRRKNVPINDVDNDEIALDIGDATIETMTKLIADAGTVVWNGTLGYAELSEFAHGSARLSLSLAVQSATTSIIGGGDTADFVLKWDAQEGRSFTHVSTGGGASLELMAGKKLPGIECLLDVRK